MKIKNLAEFKRAMKEGSKWNYSDSWRPELVTVRECTTSQSNSFALNNHPCQKDKTVSSWLDYPKAKELVFIQEEGQATKVRVNLPNGEYLIYQPATQGE